MSLSTRNHTITQTLDLITEECCNCGVTFAMPVKFKKQRLRDRDRFYCPAGHPQHYTGPTDAEKLKEAERKLANARSFEQSLRDQLEASERSKAALKGVVTRTKKRIGNGVCPCCNRSFKDLARHMAGQHPDYADGAGV